MVIAQAVMLHSSKWSGNLIDVDWYKTFQGGPYSLNVLTEISDCPVNHPLLISFNLGGKKWRYEVNE